MIGILSLFPHFRTSPVPWPPFFCVNSNKKGVWKSSWSCRRHGEGAARRGAAVVVAGACRGQQWHTNSVGNHRLVRIPHVSAKETTDQVPPTCSPRHRNSHTPTQPRSWLNRNFMARLHYPTAWILCPSGGLMQLSSVVGLLGIATHSVPNMLVSSWWFFSFSATAYTFFSYGISC